MSRVTSDRARVAVLLATAIVCASRALSGCGGRAFAEVTSERGAGGSSASGDASAGSGGNSPSGSGATAAGTGGSHALPPDFPNGSEPLSSLGSAARRAVCLEDLHRSDPCMLQGIELDDQAACESSVAGCRSEIMSTATADCEQSRDLSDCNVTVDQYFECVDAWNQLQTCENAGLLIDPPTPCVAVEECSAFRFAFERFGRAPHCAPETLVPKPPDTNDDIYGFDPCRPIPKRFVALGNSIAAAGGEDGCSARQLADYVRANYAPDLSFEFLASNGGDFLDLPRQMQRAAGGGGHVAVWIYSIPPGADQDPQYDLWKTQFQPVIDYFSDASTFPDGATFMLNTQYSPSDQCPDPPLTFGFVPLSLEKEAQLRTMNQVLFIDLAVSRSDTIAVDQYPDWLGHGWNANVRGCPHCSSDNTLWQVDPVHPNADGVRHIFEKWKVAVDQMYGDPSCTR